MHSEVPLKLSPLHFLNSTSLFCLAKELLYKYWCCTLKKKKTVDFQDEYSNSLISLLAVEVGKLCV